MSRARRPGAGWAMARLLGTLAVATTGALAGCGESAPGASAGSGAGGREPSSGDGDRERKAAAPRDRERKAAAPRDRARRVARVACPAGVAGCRSVLGRVVYVERVDPDGDGDLHVVLSGRAGITSPGLTSVDIAPALRPRRDPRPGDVVSAAGPVQRGSFGQRQVHALRVSFSTERSPRER